ncbi:MAG: cytochrome b [Oleibacter sp.]|nr:cytochrome b [Thalassolituus sp.]
MKQQLRNTDHGYGWIAIVFHWIGAIAVTGMFGLGIYMVDLTFYDPWYKGSLDLHKSLGILIALLISARLIWRIVNPSPRGLSDKKLENQAAHTVHWILYGAMICMFVSGYLISTADGRGINVFDWFTVPATLTGENQADLAGEIHEWLAWGLIGLASLHALAALKHHFLNRDATLKRMLRPLLANKDSIED